MTRSMSEAVGATIWGVRHAQGINWHDNESQARRQMVEMVAYDSRRQHQTRGLVRLLKREIGPIVEVENPYEAASSSADV